ncbi:hypothetical protein N7510_010106 [Penicillium lagena]|uniref:uncharacterized protein n=1 Tax=Penicillium lagena TaxID=94218 RepID=UPI00254143F0|nr:uncharacterized protein N7510_010106 [Penicillium lagena]KAJ5604952.1 hypothetical protein N7510_010106 [Penicillium lagena]
MSIVVNELQSMAQHDDTVQVAFFYCNYREKTTIEDIFASFLKQLVRPLPLPSRLKSLYEMHKKSESNLSLEEILELLRLVISDLSKVYFVIDALDESHLPLRQQHLMVAKLSEFQVEHTVGLLATSRDNPDIVDIFETCPILRIQAQNTDLKSLLDNSLQNLPRCVQGDPKLQDEILTAIIDAADGILQLRSIEEDKMSPNEVRIQLRSLPRGLDTAYKNTLDRIRSQSPGNVSKANEVLSWIVCASRPLRPLELQQGISIIPGKTEFDEDDLTNLDDLLSLCAGLVVIDEQTDCIRLAHYTAQEYFGNNWAYFFPDAHLQLSTKCISYLSLNVFRTEPPASLSEYLARNNEYLLYSYSAENWGHHARLAYNEIEDLVHAFLKGKFTLRISLQALREDRLFPIYSRTVLNKVSVIHAAAWFGLDECILLLLKEGHLIDTRDDDGQTALHWAIRNEQASTVEILLQKDAGINAMDSEGKSSLHHAINQRETRLLQILVANGANLELVDNKGQTPLLSAVEAMSIHATQSLLEMGAKIGAFNFMKQNVLHLAAMAGTDKALQVTKLLLSHCEYSRLSACDSNNMTPLHYAVAKGHQNLSKLLLRNGADVNIGVKRGCGGYTIEQRDMTNSPEDHHPGSSSAHRIHGLTHYTLQHSQAIQE